MRHQINARLTDEDAVIMARLHVATGLDTTGIIRLAIRRLEATEPRQEATMSRYYYGLAHQYGANTQDVDGNPIGRLEVFRTAAERDAWVANGAYYSTEPEAREVMSADDPYIRRINGTAQASGDHGWREQRCVEREEEQARQDAYDAALAAER
jgi:hypothetical protein